MNSKGLIILPAYNEGEVLEEVVKKVSAEVASQKDISVDIAIVNDGSSDNTEQVCNNINDIILLTHYINMGSGAATRTGLEYAKRHGYHFAVTVDADGQHAPKDLVEVVNKLNKDKFDLVIGSRLLDSKGMPAHRVFGNKLLNIVTRVLFGVSVTDSQSGLKAFSRKAIESIEIRSNGFEFCSEIVWRAEQANLRIAEVPITAIYTDYSMQKGQSNINALRIIKNLVVSKFREV